jgi:uncharacterized membrane protein YkvA (DUF1232 family)
MGRRNHGVVQRSVPVRDVIVNLNFITSTRRWRGQAERLEKEARVYYFAFKHPRMPWYAKLVVAGTAAYLLSPIQLIPSFIPVIGFLDDLLVLVVGVKLLRKIIPPDVLTECRELAAAAQMQRNAEIRSPLAIFGMVAIASLFLVAAVAATALIAAYIRR